MEFVQFAVLGPLQVRCGPLTVSVTAPSVRAALGYLALHHASGAPQLREAIAGRLYPERAPRQARRALSDALHAARAVLGALAGCLQADMHTVRLHGVTVDLGEFEALARSPRLQDWRRALALYRGDLLAGVDADWIEEYRHQLHNQHLGLYERVSVALEKGGHDHEALVVSQAWVQADPLNEPAHAAVIRLYARLGQPHAALRQYGRLAHLLQRELGTTPAPEIAALAAQIKAELRLAAPGATLARVAPADPPAGEATVRTVMLVHSDVPLGRRLTDADRVAVRWTIDAGAEDAAVRRAGTSADLRRHRIRRLLAEATAQGAAPTDQDLADALGVTRRTIEHDMAALRAAGYPLYTRRRARQR